MSEPPVGAATPVVGQPLQSPYSVSVESHFALASPFAGAVAFCRQSEKAWLVSRALAEALERSKQAGEQVILHFCEAAAFVAWGYMQDLQDKCLLKVAWQQMATLPISLSHTQNLMQQPALSIKAGQILLRLFAQAADLQTISQTPDLSGAAEPPRHSSPFSNHNQHLQREQEMNLMQPPIDWRKPSHLMEGKEVAATGEESIDALDEAQREVASSAAPTDPAEQVMSHHFCMLQMSASH